jgi:hypothetical protein
VATFGTTIGSGGFRFYDADHEISYNYVAGVYGGNFQGPMLLDTGDAEGTSTNLAGHWRVVRAKVLNNVIVDCPEGVRVGDNYDLSPTGCTIDQNVVIRAATGAAITQVVPPVSSTIGTNPYYATPTAGGFTQDSAAIWRKSGVGPRLTFLQAGDVGVGGDAGDTDGTGALVAGGGGTTDPPPATDTTTAAGRFGWGVPIPAYSDEFDYTGAPNPSKWSLPGSDWAGHDGNGRRRPERQTVQDGRLIMTGLANGDSGWMANRLNQEYGRYEARVRAYNTGSSNGNEYSPVLLIWPESDSRKQDGEYDYYEPGRPGSTTLTAFMHYPGDGDQQKEFDKSGVDLSQFHNIAFEWTPDGVKGYFDGVEWFSYSGGSGSGRRNIQDMGPGFPTIQLDNFDGTNQTPATFECEWFRIYTLTPVTPPPTNQTITPAGVVSREQFGFPAVSSAGTPPGPPTGTHATLLGTGDTVLPFTLGWTSNTGTPPPPAGSQNVTGAGNIATRQAFGLPLLSVADGPQSVRAIGLASAAAFGRPIVAAAPPPPSAPGGTLVPSVWAVGRDGKLTPLPSWTKLSLSEVTNSAGSLSLEYPAGTPGFQTLADNVSAHPLRALEIRIWLGGSQEGALGGWLVSKAGDDLLPGSTWTFVGHFHEWLLKKAIVGPQERTEANSKGELRFAGATPGLVLSTVMDQAQARGALPLVTRDFTNAVDSNGTPWPNTVSSFNLAPKTTLAEVADKLVELGLIEYEITASRVWRAYIADTRGVDRTTGSTPLTFAQAINLSKHARRETAEDAGTAVLAAGSEGFYAWAESATGTSELGWRAEVGVDAGQLESADAVQAYAATQLEAIRSGVAEFSGDVEFASGVPLPLVHWGVGDWAYTWVGTERRRLRIQQVSLEFTKGAPPRGTVGLNDLITNKIAALYRRLTAISSGAAVIGTSAPTPGGAGEDHVPPAAPQGLTLASTIAYRVPDQTVSLALVSAGWAAVLNDAYPDEATAGRAEAAPLIAERLRSGQAMHVNDEGKPAWTWDNCPSVVATHADALLTEFRQAFPDANLPDTEAQRSLIAQQWLRDYPAAHQGGGPVTGDVDHYRVNYTYLGSQPLTAEQQWEIDQGLLEDTTWVEPEGSPTRNTSLTFGNIEGGRSLGVRVCAVDRAGNQGPWAATVAVDTALDDQPPPTPSKPLVATVYRTMNVTWDGKGVSGEDMIAAAPDFLNGGGLEVHLAEGIDFIPDRPIVGGKLDLSASLTFKTTLYAAGTTNITGLEIGKTYFVRFVAVDRVGNASPPSETSDGVQPKQLVNIDIGPGAIAHQQIIDGEIVRAKIADLAVNSAKIEEIDVGKLTAGTMTAQVTLSGRFSTPVINGNKIEFDNAGIRLFQGNTVVGNWQVADASMLVTGTYLSGLNGERIQLLPNGTQRFYGAAGVDYAEIANDGGVLRFRSRPDSFGRRSWVDFDPTGLHIRYGTTSESRAKADFGLTYSVINAPVTGIRVLSQFAPDDGTASRFHFVFANASGDINDSVLHYVLNSFQGSDPAILAPGQSPNGSGITWGNDRVTFSRGDGNASVPLYAADFITFASTELAKRDIALIRHRDGLTSLDVVARTRAYGYAYDWDVNPIEPRSVPLQRRQSDGSMAIEAVPIDTTRSAPARRYYGLIAEQLQALAPDLVSTNGQGQLTVSYGARLALLHNAVHELAAQVRELRGETDPAVIDDVQDPARWTDPPKKEPRG